MFYVLYVYNKYALLCIFMSLSLKIFCFLFIFVSVTYLFHFFILSDNYFLLGVFMGVNSYYVMCRCVMALKGMRITPVAVG